MKIKIFWIEKLNSDFDRDGDYGAGGSDGDGDDAAAGDNDDDDNYDDDDDNDDDDADDYDGDGDDDDDNVTADGWWSWQERNKPSIRTCMWFIILEWHPFVEYYAAALLPYMSFPLGLVFYSRFLVSENVNYAHDICNISDKICRHFNCVLLCFVVVGLLFTVYLYDPFTHIFITIPPAIGELCVKYIIMAHPGKLP